MYRLLLLALYVMTCHIKWSQSDAIPRIPHCIRAGKGSLQISKAFGRTLDFNLDGFNNSDASIMSAFIVNAVNVPSVTTLANINNASVPSDDTRYNADIAYAMPEYDQTNPSMLDINWLYRNNSCSSDDAENSNYGSVNITFAPKKKCVNLTVDMLNGTTITPLQQYARLIVLLGAEVDGPPEGLDDNYYNSYWLEKRDDDNYKACFREGIAFSKYQTGKLNFFVTDGTEQEVEDGNGTKLYMETKKIELNMTGNGENKFCKVIAYDSAFKEPPMIFTTPELAAGSDGEVAAWVENTCLKDFKVCVKRTGQDFADGVDNVTIHYGAIGDKSNCDGVAASPHKICMNGTNVCISNCTQYWEETCEAKDGPYCANDFGTYPDKCEFSKYACENYKDSDLALVNITNKGECTVTPYTVSFDTLAPMSADQLVYFCKDIAIDTSPFHSFADIEVIVTPNWNATTPGVNNDIHGATGAWVEMINGTHFTACCRTTYVSTYHGVSCPINYILYQKNLKYQTNGSFEAGEPIKLPDFAISSGCAEVEALDSSNGTNIADDFNIVVSPYVTAGTAEEGLSTWIEFYVNGTSHHRFCAIAMKQFSGLKQNVTMHYIKNMNKEATFNNFQQRDDGDIAIGTSCSIVGGLTNDAITTSGRVFQSVAINVTQEIASNTISFDNDYSTNFLSVWSEGESDTEVQICIEDVINEEQHHDALHLNAFYIPEVKPTV